MSAVAKAPFVTALRARNGTIDLARAGEPSITIRVEMPEVWDVVRVSVSPTATVAVVKRAALDGLGVVASLPDEFVMKLRGCEVLDESATVRPTRRSFC